MKLNKNKKIYIFNSSKEDILDFTLEFIDKVGKVDCVVAPKDLKKETKEFITQNSKNFFSIKKTKNLIIKDILSLFSKFNEILYLRLNNDNFFDSFLDEKNFFQKKNIKVEELLNTVDIVDILNKKKIFLTDRKKNSSVIFANKLSNENFMKILVDGGIGKMFIKLENKKQLSEFLKITRDTLYFKKNYKFNLIYENKLLNNIFESKYKFKGITFNKKNIFLMIVEDVKI